MSKSPHRLIQSYVADKWMVSTVYRQSSAAVYNPPWYYETIIWEWNPITKERGVMVAVKDSGAFPDRASKNHFAICMTLMKKAIKDNEFC